MTAGAGTGDDRPGPAPPVGGRPGAEAPTGGGTPEDEGGDPACWLDRVCDACGRLVESGSVCPACGTPLGAQPG